MVAAAHVVGNMVKLAGANLGESFFNKEVGQAIQMIDGEFRLRAPLIDSDSRQEVGRFSAVLLLHQFSLYAPGQFYPFIPRVLEKIWIPLRDSRVSVWRLEGWELTGRRWCVSVRPCSSRRVWIP